MQNVVELTEEQKDDLIGQEFAEGSFFNPIQDIDGNWIISQREVRDTTIEGFEWLADCPLIEYKPVLAPFPPA